MYALLLFGGLITVDHVRGGLTVGGRTEGALRLRSWPRIAILVQQLRCVSVPDFPVLPPPFRVPDIKLFQIPLPFLFSFFGTDDC